MKRSELKELIRECIHEITTEYHAQEDFIERRDRIMMEVVNDFLKGAKRIYWPKVKAQLLARTWLLYGKRGTVDDEAVEKISDQMIDLVARLTVSTELSGHTPNDVRQELEDNYEMTFTDKQWDKLLDTLEDENGQWYLSDYGLKPLQALALRLYSASTAEDKIHVIDRMLNVVHQRSDLAGMFVEGGTSTLNKIATQGGYQTDFESFEDKVRQQRNY
jgi:hypothetical protein